MRNPDDLDEARALLTRRAAVRIQDCGHVATLWIRDGGLATSHSRELRCPPAQDAWCTGEQDLESEGGGPPPDL
jgi:hypothetical protein